MFMVAGGAYYAYLTITLPASSSVDIENTEVGQKASKVLRNGQLFLEKNGKTYNALGAEVK